MMQIPLVKLHSHIKRLAIQLQEMCKTAHDLNMHLINAYLSVSDKDFRQYIIRLQDDMDKTSTRTTLVLTPLQLIEKVENKNKFIQLDLTWKA